MDSRYANRVNMYTQGSIWMWKNENGTQNEHKQKQGVQSGVRPVLIISNNTFNQFSRSVNCLCITSVLKDSPVHEPITLDVESHIMCEQIHTVSKQELYGYKGTALPITLSNVKEKLRKQFDMTTDRSLEILTSIHDSIVSLNEKAVDGFGLPAITSEMSWFLSNINDSFLFLKNEIAKLQPDKDNAGERGFVNNGAVLDKPLGDKSNHLESRVEKRGHHKYSDEDIAFIRDENNPIQALMERFGLKNKSSAYHLRSIHKQSAVTPEQEPETEESQKQADGNGENSSGKQDKTVAARRHYTNDEIEFILDESNSADDIQKMFELQNKKAAYNLRARFKKPRSVVS